MIIKVYFLVMFSILKRILWDKTVDEKLLKFEVTTIHKEEAQEWPKDLLEQKTTPLVRKWEDTIRVKKTPLLIAAVVGIATLFFIIDKTYKAIKYSIYGTQNVKADLLIPVESFLLNRSALLSQIENKLKGKKGIQTVALVGIGGSGKTVLARHYAKRKNAALVWEINAETKGSIVSSFEALAQMLCETEQDENVLWEIQRTKHTLKREERILLFVKDKLKFLNNWLLIYDNVERFAIIQKWFPCDPISWGNGRIIVTTRDSNLQNNVHVNAAIHIGELNPTEKFNLFMKIMRDGASLKLTNVQKNEAENFLTHIPPFPLDVTVTAFYLKTTNLPYAKYLQCLKEHHKDFTNTQEAILKEVSNYTKTRHNIITLSLKKLIETHKDFAELLLLMSLLNSQNIPRDLLEGYKNSVLIDNFIHHLKKHSLITTQPDAFSPTATLSVHRNTQESILDYLMTELDLEKNPQLLLNIANAIAKYADEALEKDDIPKVRLLINHCRNVLDHSQLLTGASIGVIQGTLGTLYSYIGDYLKAQELLVESYNNLKQHYPENYAGIAQVLVHLGEGHADLGDHGKPEAFLEESLALYKQHCPDHPSKIASTLVSLGRVYRFSGRYEKSRDCLEEALAVYKKHFSTDYSKVVWSLVQLGDIYRNLSDYKKAESLFEEAMLICKQKIPENYIKFSAVALHLGKLYRDIGRYEKAIELFERSLAICKEYLPANGCTVGSLVGNLGILYREMGNYSKAKEFLEKALLIYKNCLVESNPFNAWLLGHLGNIFGKIGDLNKSKECFEKALVICKKCLPEHKPNLGWLLGHLGNIYRKMGDCAKAKELLEQSLATYNKCLPEDHVYIGSSLLRLGNVYKDLGSYEKAQQLFEQNLVIFEKRYGKDHLRTGQVLKSLGQIHLLQNNLQSAEAYLNKSLSVFQSYQYGERYLVLEDLADLFLKKSEAENNKKTQQDLKKKSIDYLNQALEIIKAYPQKDLSHLQRIEAKLEGVKHEPKAG